MPHPYPAPHEDAPYRTARNALLEAEMELRDQRERVAALRRKLPPGPTVPDYVLREGPPELTRDDPAEFFDTRLSELFLPGQDSLFVYHFMFAPDWEAGCPMCTLWNDGLNAVAPHVTSRAGLVLVAQCELAKFRTYGRARGWHNLRLLSSYGSPFTVDFGFEQGGEPLPGISVFRKEADGTVRHRYSGGAIMGEEQSRGLDLLSPVWHLFDLLPEGRGDWWPQLSY